MQLLPTPRAQEPGRTSEGYGLSLPEAVGATAAGRNQSFGQYAAAIARHERWTGQPAPDPTEPGPKGNPRLSARFVEWVMAQPAGWITDVPGVTRNEALRLCGNGVVTPQAAHALRVMLARIGDTTRDHLEDQ